MDWYFYCLLPTSHSNIFYSDVTASTVWRRIHVPSIFKGGNNVILVSVHFNTYMKLLASTIFIPHQSAYTVGIFFNTKLNSSSWISTNRVLVELSLELFLTGLTVANIKLDSSLRRFKKPANKKVRNFAVST
ncbi:unnamed protein product [Allacma fusca]|uniref:Uncharacterized protein n=1 Tax=Allacma fusca TaxID=39272 RepID=A0A8J2KYN4_9HEXA|nr:unnamed protein product [Allacma fusca]